ncbi:MAG: glycosyltransferase family 1 protein, partial [Tannerellaceae bacterium]
FDQQPYVLKAPADETPIDIAGLIAFYRNKEWKGADIRQSVSHLSWESQMQEVINQSGINRT